MKAVSLDGQSIVVSWLDPDRMNGKLSHSTVFMKTMDSGHRQLTQSFKVYPSPEAESMEVADDRTHYYVARGLNQVRVRANFALGNISTQGCFKYREE